MKKLFGFIHSLRFRLAIGFALLGILTSAVTLYLSYLQSRNDLFAETQDKLLAIAANAALQIDGDEHALLRAPADMDSNTYRDLQQKSFDIAATDKEILYVYTMRKNEAGEIYFVLDAGHEPGEAPSEYEPATIGLVYAEPSGLLVENFDTLSAPIAESDFYTDEFGTYLTAYAPFYGADGRKEGIVGVDILAQDILTQQVNFFQTFLFVFAVSVFVSATLGWLAGSLIASPVLLLVKDTVNIRDARAALQTKTNIRELRQLADGFNNMLSTLNTNEQQLRQLASSLDLKNAEIQTSLEKQNKRARQFEAIAQVARATTANESLETLLPRLTSLISEKFGFYHTGIFLLDETRTFAILRAANSEGGKRMLTRGHKLQIGQTGMVGYVSAVGTPRIALDVGDDAVYFDNPDLPNTRSEMALPLRRANEVIGVLDVQSIVSNAFQEDDIEILSTLADQVSIAIQNARSYETTQALLKEARKVSGAAEQEAWRILQSEETAIGYHVAGDKVNALTRPLNSVHVRQALKLRQTVSENGRNAALAIPIRLRDEVIGVMDIRTPLEHDWDTDEVDIAEAVAERLSLALETSLLLKSTQRRAEIERITSDISGRIGATTQFESILRTAAEELSRVLGGSEVVVQIQAEAVEETEEKKQAQVEE